MVLSDIINALNWLIELILGFFTLLIWIILYPMVAFVNILSHIIDRFYDVFLRFIELFVNIIDLATRLFDIFFPFLPDYMEFFLLLALIMAIAIRLIKWIPTMG